MNSNTFKVIFYHEKLKEYFYGLVTDFNPTLHCWIVEYRQSVNGITLMHYCKYNNAVSLEINDHPVVCSDKVIS